MTALPIRACALPRGDQDQDRHGRHVATLAARADSSMRPLPALDAFDKR